MEALLEKAKACIQKASVEGIAPLLRRDNLLQAVKTYNEACGCASSRDQITSLKRNLGVVFVKLISSHWDPPHQCSPNDTKCDEAVYYAQQACSSFVGAILYGSHRTDEWKEEIRAKVTNLFEEILGMAQSANGVDRISVLLRLRSVLAQDQSLQYSLYMALSTLQLNSAIKLQDNSEWIKSKNTLAAASEYIDEALRLSVEGWLRIEAEDLRERSNIHMCVAESMVMRLNADEMLRALLHDQEHINIEAAWDVLDLYKQAQILMREHDIEGEAVTCSRIGRIFDRIFKLSDRAHEYYKKALHLGMSLQPKTFGTHAWWQETQEFLQRLQQEVQRKADEEVAKSKQPFLDALKAELDELNRFRYKSIEDLLQHIYKAHPPKGEGQVYPANINDNRKRLLKAISHYHPDHQGRYNAGRKWEVLAEEIVKILNGRYESFKGVDPPSAPTQTPSSQPQDDPQSEHEDESAQNEDESAQNEDESAQNEDESAQPEPKQNNKRRRRSRKRNHKPKRK